MIGKAAALCLLAGSAQAGEAYEGYYYIVGAVASDIPAQSQDDFASKAFRSRVSELSEMWSAECGANVFAWHTNLMSNTDAPFAPDFWIGILAMEPTEAALAAALPESSCAQLGYVASGVMVFPTAYQYCASGDDDGTETWAETCN